jgi:glyoxylase-like metal-dependent hydrolase (beta-lactamase superfamily II)
MKRLLRVVGGVLLVLVLACAALLAVTFGGTAEIPEGRELEGFARIVRDGYVSVAVLELGNGKVALVDAGNDPEGREIRAELARRGRTPDDVAAILVTHGHPDHIAAAGLFQKAELVALEAEVPLVEGRIGADGPLPRLLPAKPTGLFVTHAAKDGELIPLGDRKAQVFSVPGHTGGSAAYLVDGVLFFGDSADATSEGHVAPAKWLFSDDQARNRASLRALSRRLADAKADVRWLVFAHSGVLAGLSELDAAGR